jgi:membrane AbrB-like protein
MLGPMFVSAIIHMAGITSTRPPYVLVAIAQIAIGAMIGCRFRAFPLRQVAATAGHAVLSVLFTLTISIAFGLTLAAITPHPAMTVILAFAPAGAAEMSLVALALNADAAFVIAHQILRAQAVTIIGPLMFRLAKRRRR